MFIVLNSGVNSHIFRRCLGRNIFKFMSTEVALKEQKLTINGQTINYLKVGNGEHKVLCFPGALGTIWSDFKPQIELLDPDKFTIVAWDPPGYGYSRPPDKKFDLNFYKTDADIAFELMKALDIDTFSLLGWSDGGISSLILSAKYSNHVVKLVVWGATAYLVPDDMKSYERVRDINKWSDQMKAPLIKLYTERGLQNMWNKWCDTVKEMYRNGGDLCKNELQNIKCPTLILHGDKDPMVAPEHPDYLVTHIKNAMLYRFPEGKHNIHLKYAKQFNKIVTDFLLN